ncbi:hypothetical protein [Mesorhizobium sp. KR9-304]|uniref:hypothetical protein n=1 Tax=Mesorhizobium sp. KR9-304 TaxID=3156614 RepID=UPI0032B562B5
MTEGRMTVLDELFEDPMVQMVMARDHVRPEELRSLLERDRVRATEKRLVPPAHVISSCRGASLCY